MGTKQWKVLRWNIQGINSEKKWNAIRDRVNDSNYDVICIQETK
jgi:exonuclease III